MEANPGVIVMTVLFASLFYGVYIIWDRKLDLLKEVHVAPVQVVLLLLIGLFVSVPLTPFDIIKAFLMLLLISIAMVSNLKGWLYVVTFIKCFEFQEDAGC